jgi:hypothetical protein
MNKLQQTQERTASYLIREEFTRHCIESGLLHTNRDQWLCGFENGRKADDWIRDGHTVLASVTGEDPDMAWLPEDEEEAEELQENANYRSAEAIRERRRQNRAVVGEYLFYHAMSDERRVLILVSINGSSMMAHLAGSSMDVVAEAHQMLRAEFPEQKPTPKDKQTIVSFWANTPRGPNSFRRAIDVPNWEEIQINYNTDVRESLDAMMTIRDGKSFDDGQLILWQGEPGTGKTYALRALAHAWLDWCELFYITDPDRFFHDSEYMMQVLFTNDGPLSRSNGKWKLLVLEDAGELMSKTAKAETGQAFGRLLNVVDGMIGQGLKVLVLITTNEQLENLHEAIQRPGRCGAQLKFQDLQWEEVAEWGKTHDVDPDNLPPSASVAELYSLKASSRIENKGRKKTMGFA